MEKIAWNNIRSIEQVKAFDGKMLTIVTVIVPMKGYGIKHRYDMTLEEFVLANSVKEEATPSFSAIDLSQGKNCQNCKYYSSGKCAIFDSPKGYCKRWR